MKNCTLCYYILLFYDILVVILNTHRKQKDEITQLTDKQNSCQNLSVNATT